MSKTGNNIEPQNILAAFQNNNIRRIWNEEEWFYSVVDIIEVLTDSLTPIQYWGKVTINNCLKKKLGIKKAYQN